MRWKFEKDGTEGLRRIKISPILGAESVIFILNIKISLSWPVSISSYNHEIYIFFFISTWTPYLIYLYRYKLNL